MSSLKKTFDQENPDYIQIKISDGIKKNRAHLVSIAKGVDLRWNSVENSETHGSSIERQR